MPWRYQPVIVKDESGLGDVEFCLIEAYFDEEHKLTNWTRPQIAPGGTTPEELQGDLVHMLTDAYSWVPVPYESLKEGMTFERALTMEQRESIARMVEAVSFASTPKII